ncbi:hypothetical protein PHMEG_00014278 [Phytophthora megakarya]|uniref:Uncharacterized protein n=1 Tax=Phytophthora megakarya TaxID=4795 RepID=A0A225W461_9STRA|nr:hypothetical protein PHMEG_00014278 [Phytophthora megakarya]
MVTDRDERAKRRAASQERGTAKKQTTTELTLDTGDGLMTLDTTEIGSSSGQTPLAVMMAREAKSEPRDTLRQGGGDDGGRQVNLVVGGGSLKMGNTGPHRTPPAQSPPPSRREVSMRRPAAPQQIVVSEKSKSLKLWLITVRAEVTPGSNAGS